MNPVDRDWLILMGPDDDGEYLIDPFNDEEPTNFHRVVSRDAVSGGANLEDET